MKAEGAEASWHMTAKPTGMAPTVNAALVHRQFASLPGEICIECGAQAVVAMTRTVAPGYQEPSAVASCPLRVEENGSNHHSGAQRDARQRAA